MLASQEKHPEKRMRAAWAAYEESELPALMQEKPGLKRQQARARGAASAAEPQSTG